MSLRILSITHQLPKGNLGLFLRKYSTEANTTSCKRLIYTSPNIGLVKFAKTFSLSTLSISAIASPAFLYFWDTPAVQASDMSSAMFLGESLTRYVFSNMLLAAVAASACSTGALTVLLSPYVNSIYLHTTPEYKDPKGPLPSIPPNSVLSIETLDFLARHRTSTMRIRHLLPIHNSVFSTWKVSKKVLERQYALEQTKGVPPPIVQHKFWLDQRNGMGNREAMSNILRLIEEQGNQRLI